MEDLPGSQPEAGGDPKRAAQAEFAERLRAAIERKGWTAADAVAHASRLLGRRHKFGSAHLSLYLSGKALPRSTYLRALSQALDVEPEDLLPRREPAPLRDVPATAPHVQGSRGADQSPAAKPGDLVHVRDYGDGTALLQILQRVSWDKAVEVMSLLKCHSRKD